MAGILSVVSTPIGNLRDITLRAIDVLKSADLIACEDTRHTHVLLDEYSIGTSTTSYHKFNIRQKTKYLIDQMISGKNVALVSDAGTPGISDPGEELIASAISAGIKIEIVPGASAAVSALAISGIRADRYTFEGFLPSKSSERRAKLKVLSGEDRTMIFYEAPHRLTGSLRDIRDALGDRRISVSRELTKKFEETTRGMISDLIKKYDDRPPRGEIVLVVEGAKKIKIKNSENEEGLVAELIKAGLSRNSASKIVSKRFGVSKNALYRGSLRG